MTALANEVCFVIILMYTHCHYLMIYTQLYMENKQTYACVYVFIWKIIFNKQVKTTQEVCNAILSCENLPCERTAGRSPVKLERPWLSLYASRFYIICNPGKNDMHWKYACVIAHLHCMLYLQTADTESGVSWRRPSSNRSLIKNTDTCICTIKWTYM